MTLSEPHGVGGLGRALARDGFAIARGVVESDVVERLRAECEGLLDAGSHRRPGMRHVMSRMPSLRGVVSGDRFRELLGELGAPAARVVRSIYFDKSAEANWLVAWHQDATIAVRERVDTEGYGPWSIKEGEHHCRPPREVLDRLLALRVHLDDNDEENGPLRVIPGSHADGLLSEGEITARTSGAKFVTCLAKAGDVVAMRPHVLHASGKSRSGARRRVFHIEFCDVDLAMPLAWAE